MGTKEALAEKHRILFGGPVVDRKFGKPEYVTPRKPIIAFDLDGTLAEYAGYKGAYIIGKPVKGMLELMDRLREQGWEIGIYSCRNNEEVSFWCNKWHVVPDWINQNKFLGQDCPNKPFADIYVDDKAIRFDGDAVDLEHQIQNFKEWWKG